MSLASTLIDSLLEPTSSCEPSTPHLQTLHHFTTIAHTTVGGPLAQQVALGIIPTIATKHAYLMHAVLGFSALHLKHLLPASTHPSQHAQHTLSSSHHCSHALTLYQATLSNPTNLTPANMDALLSTCLLLNSISMALDDPPPSSSSSAIPNPSTLAPPTTPNRPITRSFIFSPDPALALNWLGIQAGTKTLMTAFHADLHSSAWMPVFATADDDHGTYLDQRPGRAGLPAALADLCHIAHDDDDNANTNPYHAPLRLLAPLLLLPRLHQGEACFPSSSSLSSSPCCNTAAAAPAATATAAEENERDDLFTKLITFPARMRPEFRGLLAQRDHRAVLLMGYWFGLACGLEQWWIRDRARAEGWAVCEFLGRHAGRDIRELARWIARRVGYCGEVGHGGFGCWDG
jgi:Fungal specific transcription factor domain